MQLLLPHIDPADYPFPLRLRRSAKAKRLRLTVKHSGVECVVPAALAQAHALAFIQTHRDWAANKYREAAARIPASTFWREVVSCENLILPFQGRDIPLKVNGHSAASTRPRLNLQDDQTFHLHLPGPAHAEWPELSERALFDWTRRWLRLRVGQLVEQHQGRAGLTPRHVRIKRMHTRWGSCGAKNDINLNWLLALAPPAVLEYVVVHELCHIRHRNHSSRFWGLVAEHWPTYHHERDWLRNHGRALMLRFGKVAE